MIRERVIFMKIDIDSVRDIFIQNFIANEIEIIALKHLFYNKVIYCEKSIEDILVDQTALDELVTHGFIYKNVDSGCSYHLTDKGIVFASSLVMESLDFKSTMIWLHTEFNRDKEFKTFLLDSSNDKLDSDTMDNFIQLVNTLEDMTTKELVKETFKLDHFYRDYIPFVEHFCELYIKFHFEK